MGQRVDRPLAAHGIQRPLVTAVGPDAGDMPHQLAQCHGPLFLRERRHICLNHVVEVQAIVLQQQADGGGGERLGGGADPEPRVWRDGHAFLEIGPAKAFGPHDVAPDADRDRESRQVLLDETRPGDLLPLLHGDGPRWHGAECITDGTSCGFGCSGVDVAVMNAQSPRIVAGIRAAAPTISASQICIRLFFTANTHRLDVASILQQRTLYCKVVDARPSGYWRTGISTPTAFPSTTITTG